ncbi:MAG: hypothetical protein WAQ98_33570 [Blastocatellia bacterium]
MGELLHWRWALGANGPDAIFTAKFEPSDAEKLREVADKNLPSSYVKVKKGNYTSGFYDKSKCSVYESYLDTHSYEELNNRGWFENKNVWYYGQMEIFDNIFIIYNVLATTDYNETPLIVALAKDPKLTLREWEVMYYGVGYSSGTVASGTTAESLISYLYTQQEKS